MRLHLAIIGIILIVALSVPSAMAAGKEAAPQDVSGVDALAEQSTVLGPAAELGVDNGAPTCASAYAQLQSEATTAFGFNPGPVDGVIQYSVDVGVPLIGSFEIPFGIIARFDDTVFGYGKQLPLDLFQKWGILILRKEQDFTKVSGFVVPIGGTIADEQLITGTLTPFLSAEGVPNEHGTWYLHNPITGLSWSGPYEIFPGQTWDCTASPTGQ